MRRAIYGGALTFLVSMGCGDTAKPGPGAGGSTSGGGSAGSGGSDVTDAGSLNAGGDLAAAGSSGSGDSGGSSGSGGSGGSGGVETGGTVADGGMGGDDGAAGEGYVPPDEPQVQSDKVDLLLAIDNSISMADKQELLAKSLPSLIGNLIYPPCVREDGASVAQPAPGGSCPAGSARAHPPLRDVHVGVITSSLGSHGGNPANDDVCTQPGDDDHAHLLPKVRQNLTSYQDQGFLKWDPDARSTPPGVNNLQSLVADVQTMVENVGQTGCGYEAQLESVYRFLVDPEPPLAVAVPPGSNVAVLQGIDESLLQQRESFLRPDSSVVVLMLSDENDCSIQDEGYGWLLVRQNSPMFASTSACAADPNAACCQSCGEQRAATGCTLPAQDPNCSTSTTLPQELDPLNLRCFEQKRRFGFDLLYPLSRYVKGFTGAKVPSRDGTLVENPLFQRGNVRRNSTLFTFAFLGGVPWQDIATSASLNGGPLEYLSATELSDANRWPVIVGDPATYVAPSDPFMRESQAERVGVNPIVAASTTPSTSTNPRANPINGHEHAGGENDLQFACTFELPEPLICDSAAFEANEGCDCYQADLAYSRPLCRPPGGGAPSITQYYGKAYPGLRQLAVARDLGERSVLGSVCAPNVDDASSADYGYTSLGQSLTERLKTTLVP
ncbi:MAG TPA: hypothetical protein VIW29_17610 [Polyangiaceae bacterium]